MNKQEDDRRKTKMAKSDRKTCFYVSRTVFRQVVLFLVFLFVSGVVSHLGFFKDVLEPLKKAKWRIVRSRRACRDGGAK